MHDFLTGKYPELYDFYMSVVTVSDLAVGLFRENIVVLPSRPDLALEAVKFQCLQTSRMKNVLIFSGDLVQ